MTTKTDITLPPLPHYMDSVTAEEFDRRVLAWGRAAVEPYVKRIAELEAARMAYASEFPLSDDGEPDVGRIHENIRKLKAAVEADRQGRMPSDEEIYRMAEDARVWVPMGSGPEKERSLEALRSLITTALSRYSSGQPTVCQECGGDGAGGLHEDDCSQNSSGQPAASAEPLKKSEFRKAVEAMRGKPVAPVAQEPVAFLCRECDEEGWSTYAVMPNERPCPSDLMHVTPLYAAQAQSDEIKSILAAARDAGWSFEKRADGVTHMVPLVVGTAQEQSSALCNQPAAPVAAQAQPTGYEEAGSFIWDGDEWRMAAAKYGEDPDVVTLYKRVNAQDEPQQSGISGELPSAQDREDALTPAARDVLAERRRQVEAEGWTPEHDDEHADGALALAAACYAAAAGLGQADAPSVWPWAPEWWKPTDTRRNLEKAGALILAEIERIDRAAARAAKGADHG